MKPRILSSDIAHTNPWYRIRHDVLEWVNKKRGEYFVVEDNPHCVLVVEREEKLLMIRQFRHTVQVDSLEFPAGGCDDGESPEEAAKRELLEETGYKADSWKEIGRYFSANGIGCLPGHVFIAEQLTDTKTQHLDDAETGLQCFWMPVTEIAQRILDGEITDSDTLSSWAMYLAWKKGW